MGSKVPRRRKGTVHEFAYREARAYHHSLFPGEYLFSRSTLRDRHPVLSRPREIAKEMVASGFAQMVLHRRGWLRQKVYKVELTPLGKAEIQLNQLLWAHSYSRHSGDPNPLSRLPQGARERWAELLVIHTLLSRDFDPLRKKLYSHRAIRKRDVMDDLTQLGNISFMEAHFHEMYGDNPPAWPSRVRAQYSFLVRRSFLAREALDWLTYGPNWTDVLRQRAQGFRL